jgi:hypothetical protein
MRSGLVGYGISYIYIYIYMYVYVYTHTHTKITSMGYYYYYIWIMKSDKFIFFVWFIIHCCHCLVLCSEVDRMIDDCLMIEMYKLFAWFIL